MKRLISALLLVLIVFMSLPLTACELLFNTDATAEPSVEETESPGDPAVDSPSIDLTRYIPITSGGEAMINIVNEYSKPIVIYNAVESLKEAFSSAGIELAEKYVLSDDDVYEIIIGYDIAVPDKYYVDPHDLGNDGYTVRVVENKIIIAGGTDESTAKAVETFMYSLLRLDSSLTDIANLSLERDTSFTFEPEYAIEKIEISGMDISDHLIVCDTGDAAALSSAQFLQGKLYDNCGYWLDIADSASSPAIRINITDDAGPDGFRLYVDGCDLVIDCAYKYYLEDCIRDVIDEYFVTADGGVRSFDQDTEFTVQLSYITYCGFGGAVGDGVADDFEAVKKTHDRANITGQTVVADPGKTFNLGQHADSIIIKTDTVWTDAFFIIDDSSVEPSTTVSRTDVFKIMPDSLSYSMYDIKSLTAGQANVGLTFDSNVLLYLYDSDQYQYIRYGSNADSGAIQQEIILVDKDGNVDPSTPIMWDYETVSSVIVQPVDDEPISITGGHFTTVANQAPSQYTYYSRGIYINRSNVTVTGVTHVIEGEGDTGAPYGGFMSVYYCNNILFDSVTYMAHKRYWLEGSFYTNAMGTYDIAANSANNVKWLDCSQSNSITDSNYWGVMGTNYCKNLILDGCRFSRFDAHKGTYNATIVNCEIGHQNISIIGSGTLILEDTVVYGNNLIVLRGDYGSTWQGNVIIRNVDWRNTGTATVFSASWHDHYFGYTCYLPEDIVIDGLTLSYGTKFYIFGSISTSSQTSTTNPYVMPQRITVSGVDGYTYSIASGNTSNFANTELIAK